MREPTSFEGSFPCPTPVLVCVLTSHRGHLHNGFAKIRPRHHCARTPHAVRGTPLLLSLGAKFPVMTSCTSCSSAPFHSACSPTQETDRALPASPPARSAAQRQSGWSRESDARYRIVLGFCPQIGTRACLFTERTASETAPPCCPCTRPHLLGTRLPAASQVRVRS